MAPKVVVFPSRADFTLTTCASYNHLLYNQLETISHTLHPIEWSRFSRKSCVCVVSASFNRQYRIAFHRHSATRRSNIVLQVRRHDITLVTFHPSLNHSCTPCGTVDGFVVLRHLCSLSCRGMLFPLGIQNKSSCYAPMPYNTR